MISFRVSPPCHWLLSAAVRWGWAGLAVLAPADTPPAEDRRFNIHFTACQWTGAVSVWSGYFRCVEHLFLSFFPPDYYWLPLWWETPAAVCLHWDWPQTAPQRWAADSRHAPDRTRSRWWPPGPCGAPVAPETGASSCGQRGEETGRDEHYEQAMTLFRWTWLENSNFIYNQILKIRPW